MKKLSDFFAPIGKTAKVGWDKITWVVYRKRREQKMVEELKKGALSGIIVGLIGLIILIIAAYFAYGLWSNSKIKPDWQQPITNPVMTARVYVVTAGACGNKCWDTDLFLDALAKKGVKITSESKLSYGWLPFGQARDLVKKYNITKLPTVIVEPIGASTTDLTTFFPASLGNVADGRFVLTRILAPYYDISSSAVKGIIKVTYLADKTCTACYDVKKHEIALKNLGVDTNNSQILDVSSAAGKALIAKYNITKVPMFVITGEVEEYDLLRQAWPQVGIIAADGAYVFTNEDVMPSSYRDLTTGKVLQAVPSKGASVTVPAATIKK